MSGRGGRVVEGAGLENRYGRTSHRGFESHPLRESIIFKGFKQIFVADFPDRRGARVAE